MGNLASTPVEQRLQKRKRQVTTAVSHAAHALQRLGKKNEAAGVKFGVEELYTPVKLLGAGAFGEAWLCREVKTGREVAIKLIERPIDPNLQESFLREFTIQADLSSGCENIVKAYEALLTPTHLCLVMECAGGGILTGRVADKAAKAKDTGLFLSEDEARYFFKQFLSAVKYCHSHHVAHRDLKLDNTLLDASTPPVIKLCDFGFAKQWHGVDRMFTQLGTPVYMGPELLMKAKDRNGYDGRSVDVWACGVLLHVMLLGSFPFDHAEHPDAGTSEALLEVWVNQVSRRWSEEPHVVGRLKSLSPEATDLLNRIFVVDARHRITIEQIEEHPWFCKPLPHQYQAQIDRLHQKHAAAEARRQQLARDEEAVRQRDERLVALIAEATKGPAADAPPPPLQRINLREEAVLAPAATAGT